MNRRGFIGSLLGATSALVLDPERLLWVPGAKTISIPKPGIKLIRYFSAGGRFMSYDGGDMGRGSGSIAGICLSTELDAVRRLYGDCHFDILPYDGNENRYHQMKNITRTHYAG